jgi:gamma-glutamyltranspeptidase/glutathione hydrolase
MKERLHIDKQYAYTIAILAVASILMLSPAEVLAGQTIAECSDGGMVASACPVASAVGRDILARGGNAVDAAVAVGFALAVTFPNAGNIGGGGFMLIRLHSGVSDFIDYREMAPLAASRDMYLDGSGNVIDGSSVTGHLAAGVPGSVVGLHLAHELYGSMEWEEVIAPAIELTQDGFPVSTGLSESLERLQKYVDRYPGLRKFMRPDGSPLQEGDIFVQPDLTRTLERIADAGPDGFYAGETARFIIDEMQNGKGLITYEDLSRYRAVRREPVTGSYRGYDILSAPPPSSGGIVLLEILNILEGYNLGIFGFLSAGAVHRMTEAERFAYYDRATYLGDPDYVDIPVTRLISKEYADELRSFIRPGALSSDSIGAVVPAAIEGEETTHYSIVDLEGNAVATTTTLNSGFGCKAVVNGAGFLLNNEMDDFSIKPGIPNIYGLTGGEANAIEPGKRMLSSMTPTIVTRDGELFLVLGTPGGSTIITTVAQIIVNVIDFDMNGEVAVSAPRFHHQWMPDRIMYESGAFSDILILELENMGYTLYERFSGIGDAQVVWFDGSSTCGVSDPRGYGEPRGTLDNRERSTK